MNFDHELAISARRDVKVFTDLLGKKIIDLQYVHAGSIIAFRRQNVVAEDYFNYDTRKRNRKEDIVTKLKSSLAREPRNACKTYLILLTHYDNFDISWSRKRVERVKTELLRTLRIFKHMLGADNLFVIFPKDVIKLDVLKQLADANIQTFTLPYNVSRLHMSVRAQAYCNHMIHQYLTYRYLKNLREKGKLCENVTHYLLTNLFHLLSIADKQSRETGRKLIASLSDAPHDEVEEVMVRLCGLTLREKIQLPMEELAELTVRISRLFL
jgi:hypothetical protein